MDAAAHMAFNTENPPIRRQRRKEPDWERPEVVQPKPSWGRQDENGTVGGVRPTPDELRVLAEGQTPNKYMVRERQRQATFDPSGAPQNAQ